MYDDCWGTIEFDGNAVVFNGKTESWDFLDAEHFGMDNDRLMALFFGDEEESDDYNDFYADCL